MLAARSHATSSRQPHPHIHQVSRSYLVVKLGDPYASRRNHNIFDLVGHGFERLKKSRKQQRWTYWHMVTIINNNGHSHKTSIEKRGYIYCKQIRVMLQNMTSDLQYQVFFSQKFMSLFKSERKIDEDSTVAWKCESMYLLTYGRVLILPQCCAVFRLIGYPVQHTIFSLISSFVEFVEHMNISSPSPVKLRDGSKIHPQVFKIKLTVLCQRCCKRKRTYGTQSRLIIVSMYQFEGSVEKLMDLIVTLGHWVYL